MPAPSPCWPEIAPGSSPRSTRPARSSSSSSPRSSTRWPTYHSAPGPTRSRAMLRRCRRIARRARCRGAAHPGAADPPVRRARSFGPINGALPHRCPPWRHVAHRWGHRRRGRGCAIWPRPVGLRSGHRRARREQHRARPGRSGRTGTARLGGRSRGQRRERGVGYVVGTAHRRHRSQRHRAAAAILGGSDGDYDQIAAVTTGHFLTGHTATSADRVLLNPDAFAELSSVGRRVVLTHETTHVAARAASTGSLPAWLSEVRRRRLPQQ